MSASHALQAPLIWGAAGRSQLRNPRKNKQGSMGDKPAIFYPWVEYKLAEKFKALVCLYMTLWVL